MEGEVRRAFAARPRLVEQAPGFLGLEVFTDEADAATFHLVTRWTDRASFEAWHGSEDHRLSHNFIPRGLKLDPAYTRVEVAQRLPAATPADAAAHEVADSARLLARHLETARALCLLVADGDGTIVGANDAACRRLGRTPDALRGTSLWSYMVASDAERLADSARTRQGGDEPALLNFVGPDGAPFTLRTRVDVRPSALVLLGEPLVEDEQRLSAELIALNNELAVLVREHARQSQLLARAHAELEVTHRQLKESHWHLRKLQEVLPICLRCHKVKTSEGQWDELAQFFREHSEFLSHGYCPECAEVTLREFGAGGTGT